MQSPYRLALTARSLPCAVLLFALLVAVACDDGGGEDDTSPTTTRPPATVAGDATSGATSVTTRAATTPTPAVTPGIPTSIVLSAEPQQLNCDGVEASTVTARVLDSTGAGVEDGTDVEFSVVALGTADPIDATTSGGIATTRVTAVGRMVGVVVNVTSGPAAAAIRIDCL